MPSNKNTVRPKGRFPAVIISFVLLLAGLGLWLYTGSKLYLIAAMPAAIFAIVAALAGVLLLLRQTDSTGKPRTE